MALTLGQFAEKLTKSGLLSAEELTAFQESLPPDRLDAHGSEGPEEGNQGHGHDPKQ
jgi:hypothetical protein